MASSHRFTAPHSALLVVDVQSKLMERIVDRDALIRNAVALIKAAQLLDIHVLATEQYPAGLGPSVPEVAELIAHRPGKTTFQCCASTEILEQLNARGVRKVTLVGIEAHVCVAQTALELMTLGFHVQVLADAVSSRHVFDRDIALRRLEASGSVVSSTEAALFEWTESAEHRNFKAISSIVKELDKARSAT